MKRVSNTAEFGVVVTDADDRVQGFQEKPDPAEALSDRANCMIYAFDPEVFDHFPDKPAPDFALDVFPGLLDGDIPFHVYETEAYWNDVGSLPEYLTGNLDAVEGRVAVDLAGEMLGEDDGERLAPGRAERRVAARRRRRGGGGRQDRRPLRNRTGSADRSGARVKQSVLLPGAEVPERGLSANSIAGRVGALGDGS